MTRAFLDTNVLVYAYSSNDRRVATARQLMEDGGSISVQCLNEFAFVALRKLGMDWDAVFESLEIIRAFCGPPLSLDSELHLAGLRLAQQHRLSVYDGMIVAAALQAGCDTLYSEDMHHGLAVEGRLRIVNPFA